MGRRPRRHPAVRTTDGYLMGKFGRATRYEGLFLVAHWLHVRDPEVLAQQGTPIYLLKSLPRPSTIVTSIVRPPPDLVYFSCRPRRDSD